MKRSLGRSIVWICMLHSALWGINYHWDVTQSPALLRVGQSGVIRYTCTFDGSAVEYSTKLKLSDSPQYTTSVLSQKTNVLEGKRRDTIDVLITPKTSGVLSVPMRAIVRYTSPGAVENTVLGRDNLSREDISETETTLPSVTVRTEQNSAALTGNITMEAHVDQTTVSAHEPTHLSVVIRGSGNLEQFVPFELNISGVRVFSEPPQKRLSPSSDGVEGEIRQEFALIADKAYVIPALTLSVFDTLHNAPLTLKSEAIPIEVKEGYDPASLLDAPDLSDRATLKRYAYNAGWVIVGIVLTEISRWLWKKRPRRKNRAFWEGAKTSKELVMILALSGDKEYEPIIAELEAGRILLGEAKKKLGRLSTDKKVTL